MGRRQVTLGDKVITHLESADAQAHPEDSGVPGTDGWEFGVSVRLRFGFGVLDVADCSLRILTLSGNELASARAGEPIQSITLPQGRYRLEIKNERTKMADDGSVERFVSVGWLKERGGRTAPAAGLYAVSTTSPWPKFHGDMANTGRGENASPPDYESQFQTPSQYIKSSPVIGADGTVFVCGFDGVLYAQYPTNEPWWNYSFNEGCELGLALATDGTIYVPLENHLAAVGFFGLVKWKIPIAPSGSPALGHDGTIYVADLLNGTLNAITPQGAIKWSSPAPNANGCVAIAGDGTLYVGSQSGQLYAFTANGALKWTAQTGGANPTLAASPAIGSDGTIYIGSAGDGKLYAFNPNGALKWATATSENIIATTAAIAEDGTIYVGSFDNNLYAFNPNGTIKWKLDLGDQIWSSPVLRGDGEIYVGTWNSAIQRNQKFYRVSPNGTTSAFWQTSDGFVSTPAVGVGSQGGSTVYVAGMNGIIYGF